MDGGDRPSRSPEELLHQDRFTPEELAAVLDMDVSFIRQEAFNGRLKAEIVEHHILSIRREDVLQWLADRETERI